MTEMVTKSTRKKYSRSLVTRRKPFIGTQGKKGVRGVGK